ncbi:FG-GAP repeat domain-containing protein [Streptomyces sp. NPDC056169]|uniref:FG-GAP repeat domain-containing protein n=1 Tax=Streptomyces sp. NPDC056169 TaxID=3345734 RepID=UPI0035E07967
MPCPGATRRFVTALATILAVTSGASAVSSPAAVAASAEDDVTLIRHSVPPVIDMTNRQYIWLDWELSGGTWAKIVIRNIRTGHTTTDHIGTASGSSTFRLSWDTFDAERGDVPDGDYTWTITTETADGTPLDFKASGSFKLVRRPAAHDLNVNGAFDLLQRTEDGRLYRTDSTYYSGELEMAAYRREYIGPGWQAYDRIEAVGNLGGSAVSDVLARDVSGALWFHAGNGKGGFYSRIRVGIGWQIYSRITGGGDLTGDGRPDVLAADKAGVLWLHPGTGNATSPFTARKKLGAGWGVYNDITAVGNIAGGPAGDLLARDTAGVLWSYLGKGDGTFAPRTRVGGGWNTYSHLIASGDVSKDGRPDLLAIRSNGDMSLYRGTGNWKAPLLSAQTVWSYSIGFGFDHAA